MKKLLFLAILSFSISLGINAQDKDKIKKTSTPTQKVHNAVSRHNHYKGYKVKHKHNGVTRKHKVNYKTGEVKNKTEK